MELAEDGFILGIVACEITQNSSRACDSSNIVGAQ